MYNITEIPFSFFSPLHLFLLRNLLRSQWPIVLISSMVPVPLLRSLHPRIPSPWTKWPPRSPLKVSSWTHHTWSSWGLCSMGGKQLQARCSPGGEGAQSPTVGHRSAHSKGSKLELWASADTAALHSHLGRSDTEFEPQCFPLACEVRMWEHVQPEWELLILTEQTCTTSWTASLNLCPFVLTSHRKPA